MKILITGAKGFIGKNLIAALKNRGINIIYEYDTDTDPSLLNNFCKEVDFVYHLAGVNRPEEEVDFHKGNVDFSRELLDLLKEHNNRCPILITSSVQALLDNPYGRSKRMQEEVFIGAGKEGTNPIYIYRLSNVFGKWNRANYNSVIATFCYNITRGLPIQIDQRGKVITFLYIDDVVNDMVNRLECETEGKVQYCEVYPQYQKSIGEISDLINEFHQCRSNLRIPNMSDDFTKKLYSTYLSYCPADSLGYPLKSHHDHRGCFAEFLRLPDSSQLSINLIKPGIRKGDHWHNTKVEKFLVVSGSGVIRLRPYHGAEVVEYFMSGSEFISIDIPGGYVHQIENTGEQDMVVVIWSNEYFHPETPDTYYKEV